MAKETKHDEKEPEGPAPYTHDAPKHDAPKPDEKAPAPKAPPAPDPAAASRPTPHVDQI